jgi:hypothetical protein
MGDGEFARPHLAAAAVDLDLGDDRDHGTRALGIGDAAAGQGITVAPRSLCRFFLHSLAATPGEPAKTSQRRAEQRQRSRFGNGG